MHNAYPTKRDRKSSSRPPIQMLESRLLLAAHIVGSSTVYSTIQAAVNAAGSGAVIKVDAGTYAEKVSITKPLTIDGAQAGVDGRLGSRIGGTSVSESIVSGAVASGIHSCAFYVNANDVTIDGFTVQGETSSDDQIGAGIVIAPSHAGTHILNNVVQNNVSGLFLANNSTTDATLIQHNYFANNNNAGDNGGRGIYTDGTISGGNLTNVTIDSNTFVGNHGGAGTQAIEAACAFEATHANQQSNIRITNNVMTANGKAVLFFNTTTISIANNVITGCIDQGSGALRFEGNNHTVSITGNTADNNTGPAVAIDSKGVAGDSSAFVINNNNFFNNNTGYSIRLSLVYNTGVYDGTLDVRNNWWGSASGPSGDGKGTGDAVSAGQLNSGPAEGWTLVSGGTELFSPWLTALYGSTPTTPTAPTGLTATASGSTQITLAWTDTAAGIETGFLIQRSTDGVNFSQIGTTGAGVTTYVDTANLVVGSTYSYRVIATNSVGNSPPSNLASATVQNVSTVTTYVSDLAWVSATTGYGTIGKNVTVNGNPITLRGTVYAKGIGTHAVSQIVYNLNSQYTTFLSDVGVDDEENGKGPGSVDFQVLGDGKVLFDSGVLTSAGAVPHISVSVAGVKQLTLIANNGIAGSIDYDHADWAGARLVSQPTAPTAPTAPSGLAAVALSASQIQLTWTNTAAGNQSALQIDRSTDGVAFTTIAANVSPTATTYTDTSLSAATKYYYQIRATNGVGSSPNSAIVSATTFAATATATYLSDLTPTSATIGWGSIQKDKSVGGNTITLRGTTYTKGIGTHAVSQIVYALSGQYTTFISDVGVDDEENSKGVGSVDFQVIGDGKILFDSGVLTNASAIVSINISIVGVKSLTLLATNGVVNSIDYDHADWAGAKVI